MEGGERGQGWERGQGGERGQGVDPVVRAAVPAKANDDDDDDEKEDDDDGAAAAESAKAAAAAAADAAALERDSAVADAAAARAAALVLDSDPLESSLPPPGPAFSSLELSLCRGGRRRVRVRALVASGWEWEAGGEGGGGGGGEGGEADSSSGAPSLRPELSAEVLRIELSHELWTGPPGGYGGSADGSDGDPAALPDPLLSPPPTVPRRAHTSEPDGTLLRVFETEAALMFTVDGGWGQESGQLGHRCPGEYSTREIEAVAGGGGETEGAAWRLPGGCCFGIEMVEAGEEGVPGGEGSRKGETEMRRGVGRGVCVWMSWDEGGERDGEAGGGGATRRIEVRYGGGGAWRPCGSRAGCQRGRQGPCRCEREGAGGERERKTGGRGARGVTGQGEGDPERPFPLRRSQRGP